MLELVKVDYEGRSISFSEDGWFNATAAAERFGKRPNDWLSLEDTKQYIEVLGALLNTGSAGILIKAKRGKNGGTWLHPKLAVPFARWLDIRFAVWCDLQIEAILNKAHPHYDWKKLRHGASASFKVMNQVLQIARQRLGKTCAPHHFSNEARLINYALTGEFGKVDRDGLSHGDLDLLAKLESLNTVLIGCGASYQDRKTELERYATEQRGPRLIEPSVEQTSGQLGA